MGSNITDNDGGDCKDGLWNNKTKNSIFTTKILRNLSNSIFFVSRELFTIINKNTKNKNPCVANW